MASSSSATYFMMLNRGMYGSCGAEMEVRGMVLDGDEGTERKDSLDGETWMELGREDGAEGMMALGSMMYGTNEDG